MASPRLSFLLWPLSTSLSPSLLVIYLLLAGVSLTTIQLGSLIYFTELTVISDANCFMTHAIHSEESKSPSIPIESSSTLGLQIVQASYAQTFGRHIPCLTNTSGWTWQDCLDEARYIGDTAHWPWWFQTMVRDAHPDTTVHSHWHWLDFHLSPQADVQLCSIEKIGTKNFRQLQCRVNYNVDNITQLQEQYGPNFGKDGICRHVHPQYSKSTHADPTMNSQEAILQLDSNSPKQAVFLRDPLERFLSAFLDKCLISKRREYEGHCQPRAVFSNEENERLVYDIIDEPKRFFDAYVDTMPLRWDVHFFPQSFYCDGLGRTIQNYDFVGYMNGSKFYNDLYEFGTKYGQGTNFPDKLEETFDLAHRRSLPNKNPNKTYSETSAFSEVHQYYTARSVKRVLQYFAIDYIRLNLPIPEWAEAMLQEETSEFGVVL